MYVDFDNQLLSLYLSQRIRRSIPLFAILLILITYFSGQAIRENRIAANEAASTSSSGSSSGSTSNTPSTSTTSTSSSISYTYLGPTSACTAWQRSLNDEGYRADTISSDAISDSNGDWYFADSVTSLRITKPTDEDTTEMYDSINLNFRFRKLSVLGVEVTSAPLFGQPPALVSGINVTADYPSRSRYTNKNKDMDNITGSSSVSQRLFVVMAVHEPSSTTIVIQNGLYNASTNSFISSSHSRSLRNTLDGPLNNGIFFSTIALHSNIDGFCLWGHSFLSSNTNNITYTCNTIDTTNTYSVDFVPFSIVASKQIFPVDDAPDMCYSWVYLLGTSNNLPQLDGFQLVFACTNNDDNGITYHERTAASSPAPVLQHVWSSLPIACDGSNGILCSDWNTGYGVTITSLVFWNTALLPDSIPIGPSSILGSILFAAYPLVALDPWPNVTDILIRNSNQPLTELIAINTTNDSEIWKLSTDIRSNIPIVAIVSNLVVSDTGIVYFAAVKNTTDRFGTVQWERILVSVDGSTGSVLWISSSNIFTPSSFLNPGDELELLSLSLTSTALLYCGLRPSNSTDNGSFGLGAVDIAGGALLWRDTLDYNYVYPSTDSNQRNWNPVRIAYCASNLLNDDKYIYTVIGRRPQLQTTVVPRFERAISSSSSLKELAPLQYAVYARSVATGDVLWEYTIGDASSVDGSAGGGINVPVNGTAGDYWSTLQPFDIAPAPGRRLLMKYDSLILSSSSSGPSSLSLSMDYGALPSVSSLPSVTLPTSGITLLAFRCPTRTTNGFEYIYVSISVLVSIFLVRCIGGCIWSTITVHSYNLNDLTSKVLRKAADQALRQLMYNNPTVMNVPSRGNGGNNDTNIPPTVLDHPSKDNSRVSTSSTYQSSSKGHRSSRGSTDSTTSTVVKDRNVSRTNSRSSIGSVSSRNSSHGGRKNSLSGIQETNGSGKRNPHRSNDPSPSSTSSSSSSSVDSIEETKNSQVPSIAQRQIPRSKDRKTSRRSNNSGSTTRNTVKDDVTISRAETNNPVSIDTNPTDNNKHSNGRRKPLGPAVAFGTATFTDNNGSLSSYNPGNENSLLDKDDNDLDFDIEHDLDMDNNNSNVDPSIYDDLDKLCMVSVCSTGMDNSFSSSSSSHSSAAAASKQNKYYNSLPINVRNYLTSRYFCRSGNPWVLLSVIHYVTVLTALYLSVQESVTTMNRLQSSLANPLQFYSQYLINRSPSTTAACRSQAAAACYCTDTNPSPILSNATCFTNGITCDFDIRECARSCGTVLSETGNCAASVFSYTCGCGPDCASTQFYPNTSSSIKGYNGQNVPVFGLPAGLAMCSSHYTMISWVLWAAVAGYTICAVIAVWVHLDLGNPFLYCYSRKKRTTNDPMMMMVGGYRSALANNSDKYGTTLSSVPQSSPLTKWRNRMTNALRELAGYNVIINNDASSSPDRFNSVPSSTEQLLENTHPSNDDTSIVRQMFPPLSTTEGTVPFPQPQPSLSNYETGDDNVFAVMASPTTRSKYHSRTNMSTDPVATGVALSSAASLPMMNDTLTNTNHSTVSLMNDTSASLMNGKKRSPLFVLPQPTKGTYVVTHVVFIVLCQIAIMVTSLLWTSFLILQGRYCTGADGQTTGTGIPFIGDQIPPSKSLILRYVPGCAFGASWQDADYEGNVLTTVYRCMLVQVFAILLLGIDQIFHLLHVCLHRCNSILKLRKQQLYYSGKSIRTNTRTNSSWFPWWGKRGDNTNSTTGSVSAPVPFTFIDISKIWVPEAWLSPDTFPRRIFCCSRYIPSIHLLNNGNGWGAPSPTAITSSISGTKNPGSVSGNDKYATNGYTLTPSAILDHEDTVSPSSGLHFNRTVMEMDRYNNFGNNNDDNSNSSNVYGCIIHTPCIEIACGLPEKM